VSSPAVAPIKLVSIGKRYSGTKALDNVSVEVAGGTVHALVGANGAGKSTLGKIIGGVIRPDNGQLFVDDRLVRYQPARGAHRRDLDDLAGALADAAPERDRERLLRY
jgi:ABC-type sugar transport system ATPase subunit